jgi:hypothetical protein
MTLKVLTTIQTFDFIAKNHELLLVRNQKDIVRRIGWVRSTDFTRPTENES